MIIYASRTIASILDRAAISAGVAPSLVRAIAWVESAWKRDAASSAGAIGLMQLMPATCRDWGVTDATDPVQNAVAGAKHIARYLKRFDGDVSKALAAYNWGPARVARAPGRDEWPRQVQLYVERVLARAAIERTNPTHPYADETADIVCELCGAHR
jgi:soluble lytic murein transglycosylase-like protein